MSLQNYVTPSAGHVLFICADLIANLFWLQEILPRLSPRLGVALIQKKVAAAFDH